MKVSCERGRAVAWVTRAVAAYDRCRSNETHRALASVILAPWRNI